MSGKLIGAVADGGDAEYAIRFHNMFKTRNGKKLLIFDFFAGTGSSTKAFADDGHTVITFELNPDFNPTHCVDIMQIHHLDLLKMYGRPDFVWASPPCTSFSVAAIGRNWSKDKNVYTPKTQQASDSLQLVEHVVNLIQNLDPKYGFLIENPRGMLRKLPPVQGLNRNTITYCQYGDSRMKPTDLWGYVPNWNPRPACKNGDTCHDAAPRGARTGTQGIVGPNKAAIRSMVPYELGFEILQSIKGSHE